MTIVSPATALARSLQDKLGTADLSDPAVLAAVGGVIRELVAHYQSQVAGLEAEIARRDAVDQYRLAVAQAGAILHDRPDLVEHVPIAAEMILHGSGSALVRAAILQMTERPH